MTDKKDMTFKVADTEITIHRVKVKNLNEVTRAFQPFVKEFDRIVTANDSMPSNELMTLIGSYTDEAVILATVLTDQNASFYRELEPLEFFNVMQEVVAFSGDFYATDFHSPKKARGAAQYTWYDSLLPFYKIGLREADILDMVFGEWWGLSKALAKDARQTVKDMAVAMRISKADKKGWADFMKE